MNLGQLKTMSRTYMREAKINTIGDIELELILNNGAQEVASRSICLKKDTKFDSEAGVSKYNLTSKLERYLVMDKPGVWYRNTTSENYVQLDARTIKWLDENKPGWRDLDSDRPTDYVIHGDTLLLVPAPKAAVTAAIHVYYGQAPEPMTTSGHFPFGFLTEITRLKPLQEAILLYWCLKAVKSLNAGIDAYRAAETSYERELAKGIGLVDRRKDLFNSRETKIRPKKWGRSAF